MKIKVIERIEFSCTRKEAEILQKALDTFSCYHETTTKDSARADALEDLIFLKLHKASG